MSIQARAPRTAVHVPLGGDPATVDACVIMAFTSGAAFFAQYDQQGIDSRVRRGIAGDRNRRVTYLLWDSDTSGGSDTGAVVDGERCLAHR